MLLLLIFSLLVLYRFYYFNSFRFVSFFFVTSNDGWMNEWKKKRKTKLEVDWLKKSPRTLQKKRRKKNEILTTLNVKKCAKLKFLRLEWRNEKFLLYNIYMTSRALAWACKCSFLCRFLFSFSFSFSFFNQIFFSEG